MAELLLHTTRESSTGISMCCCSRRSLQRRHGRFVGQLIAGAELDGVECDVDIVVAAENLFAAEIRVRIFNARAEAVADGNFDTQPRRPSEARDAVFPGYRRPFEDVH